MKLSKIALAMSLTGACMTREAGGGKTLPDFNRDVLNRTFTSERSEANDEDRTIELSFSSEIEVQRWFGIEILDHTPGAMRTERINSGSPLLMDHNGRDQIGVIERAHVDADRKGRAKVRFSKSARGEEIFQDVKDGIRKLVSVGYRVLAAKFIETRENGDDVYLITDWEPYEISIVSVPADASVGVGRSAEIPQVETPLKQPQNTTIHKRNENMNEKILRDASGNLVRAKVDENGAIVEVLEVLEKAGESVRSAHNSGRDAERNRVRSITELGERFKDPELAAQYIKDGGSPDDMQRALLAKFEQRSNTPIGEQSTQTDIGLTDKEIRQFSLMRAVRALMPNASSADRDAAKFEFECSEAAQRAYGKTAQGLLVPSDVLNRAFNAGGAANTPAGSTSGANIVATDLMAGSFIEMLRNKTTIMRLGTTMAGLVGNVDVPKQTGGATAYWVGEDEDATEGTPTIGQIELSPKTVAAYTDITRRLLQQSTPDAERIVWNDLVNALGQAIDYAGYYGSGASNQPRGLKNYTGINAVPFATAGKPTYPEVVDMESQIAADNADIDSMAYVFNALMRGHLKTAPKFGTGTESTIWEQGGTVNGYRTEVTNQVATGDVFFGNFADLLIGLWGGLDITVDPYSLSKSGGTRIVAFQDVDFALRRVESICYGVAS